MKVEILFIDLDGTAVDSPLQKVASPRLAQATRGLQDMGVIVCAATGRPLTFARPILKTMELNGPAIVAGGTKIIDAATEKELWSSSIPSESLKKIINQTKGYKLKALWNDYEEADYLDRGGWDLSEFDVSMSTYFFEFTFVPHEEALDIIEKLKNIEGVAVVLVVSQREGHNDIHIVNERATKEHAVQEVLNRLGIEKINSVGVGDGHNDIHLFNGVNLKVAMGNAVEDLINEADQIIDSVKDEGLAKFFEKIIENGGEL